MVNEHKVRSAKELTLKVIPASIANPFVRAHHYSGKVVNNSSLHFGVFLDGRLHGVMSYGPSLVKAHIIGLVAGTGWNEYLELNRMAFDSFLPRNSESRAISQSIKLLKKHAPHVKWIISFADACSCGDGAIYRASNFVLTGIKPNEALYLLPDAVNCCVNLRGRAARSHSFTHAHYARTIHKLTLEANPETPRPELGGRSFFDVTDGKFSAKKYLEASGGTLLPGWQLRYMYFIDPAYRAKLTVPELPFSRIDELGAGMYRGERITVAERHVGKG